MRAIFLGIKDYVKDTFHDKICRLAFKIDPALNFYVWKEGSVGQYIRNRKIGLTKWDPSEYLKTRKDIKMYLNELLKKECSKEVAIRALYDCIKAINRWEK